MIAKSDIKFALFTILLMLTQWFIFSSKQPSNDSVLEQHIINQNNNLQNERDSLKSEAKVERLKRIGLEKKLIEAEQKTIDYEKSIDIALINNDVHALDSIGAKLKRHAPR